MSDNEPNFHNLIKTNPALEGYIAYLKSDSAFGRIVELSARLKVGLSYWKDKVTLDLAGGHIGTSNGDSLEDPLFYPWFSTAMSLLSANPYSVDKGEYDISRKSAIDMIKKTHTYIDSDLKDGLGNPEKLQNDLEANSPELRQGVDLINCRMLVSQSHRVMVSPYFGFQIGLDLDRKTGVPLDTDKNNKIINTYIGGVMEISIKMLKNGGILFLNNEIYRKKGDKLIWIPNKDYFEAKSQWDEMSQKQPINPFTSKPFGEGTLGGNKFISYRLSQDGSRWEFNIKSQNKIEPLP